MAETTIRKLWIPLEGPAESDLPPHAPTHEKDGNDKIDPNKLEKFQTWILILCSVRV